MTETIGVLVVFFIIVLFAIIFYAQYQKSSIQEQKEAAIIKRAVSTSLKTFYLPEMRCTRAFDVTFTACIDIHKADIFRQKLQNNENYNYYTNIFGKSHIYLENVMFPQDPIEIYNGTPAKWTRKIPIRFPVLIYDITQSGTCGDVAGRCDFGVLSVDVYE
ncbi:hypothetical protein KY343_00670 [Candidatus Woesearchaeota archaeon]|nr:hypothetical protein [Candidatus Woesearchaeota archaeon]